VEIDLGGMRELHGHPNTDEWQYYISGQARMTMFASGGGKARTFNFQAGDVGYAPFAMGHYVEDTGDETLRFLERFRSSYFRRSVAQSMDGADDTRTGAFASQLGSDDDGGIA
jgi:oxalate decarboxylase